MKQALIPISVVTLCGMMAAQAGTVPPPPPQPYSSTPQATTPAPAAPSQTPATPSPAPRPARPRVQVYRGTPVVTNGSYLGVDVRDVTPDRVGPLKLKNDEGVEITMVDQDAPAGKAGLKEHDVVVSFNGQSVQSSEQLRRLIRETKSGQSVPVGIMRDGQSQTVNVTLADAKKLATGTIHRMIVPAPAVPSTWMVHVPDIDIPSFVMTTGSRRNGITVEGLTNQLGDYFGVKNGEGVLVRSVEKGSRAEAAGLKAGDVIVRVDNERVSDTRDWSRLLRNHDAGAVKLGIMRERREQTLSMTLPEEKSDESSVWYSGPDLENLRLQLQNLGPQFGHDQAELQARIAREMAAHQKEIQSAMREAQREIEQSMREYQRDHERTMREMQSERERNLRDMQREKERQQREKEKAKEKANQDQDQ